MKVVSINENKDKTAIQRKEEILKMLDDFRLQVENDEIHEFISVSSTTDGSLRLHIACYDIMTAIGMFEIGKLQVIGDFDLG